MAAHKDTLKDDRGESGRRKVGPEESLRDVVKGIICCPTCNHAIINRSNATVKPPDKNNKDYLTIMSNVRERSSRNKCKLGDNYWSQCLKWLGCPPLRG